MDIDQLIEKYVTGTLSEVESGELSCYIRKEDAHKQYFYQKIKEWEDNRQESGEMPEWKELKAKMKTGKQPMLKKRKIWGSIAAVIFLGLVSSLYISYSGIREKDITIKVPYGQVRRIVLPDQSEVVLNAGSVLTYRSDFGGKHRKVELEGEGFFSVHKQEGKQFIVSSGNIEAIVLGTRFNFNSFGEKGQVAVTLCTGSLKMHTAKEEMLMVPGEQICYADNNLSKRTVDTLNYCMWREGCLLFQAETLETVAGKLERKFGVSVQILSPEIRSVSFSGLFKEDATLEYILRVLKMGSPVPIEIEQMANRVSISVRK